MNHSSVRASRSAIFGSFLCSITHLTSRRSTSAAIHSRAWLLEEYRTAGRVPSGTLRASAVTFRTAIGLPSVDVPMRSYLTTSRLSAASWSISSWMPPGSMNWR